MDRKCCTTQYSMKQRCSKYFLKLCLNYVEDMCIYVWLYVGWLHGAEIIQINVLQLCLIQKWYLHTIFWLFGDWFHGVEMIKIFSTVNCVLWKIFAYVWYCLEDHLSMSCLIFLVFETVGMEARYCITHQPTHVAGTYYSATHNIFYICVLGRRYLHMCDSLEADLREILISL